MNALGNAISNALDGLRRSQNEIAQSAGNIARTTAGTGTAETSGGTGGAAGTGGTTGNAPLLDGQSIIELQQTDFAEETVNILQAEISFKANANILSVSQDLSREITGLLDDEA